MIKGLIVMPPVTRLGDLCTGHGCFIPRASISASPNVFANDIAVVRVGDTYDLHGCKNCRPHSGSLASGSSTVFVNGLPVGRMGDSISCGSTVAKGSPDVIIGG